MSTSLKPLRQVTVEILARAVCELFPKTQLVESKVSDIGFHYDFILANPIDSQALSIIEERMRFLLSQETAISTLDMMRTNAIDFFKHRKQHLLCDLLENSSAQFITLFKMDDFIDVSSVNTYANTTEIKCAFKLQDFEELTLALSEKDTLPLTRISGTVFPDSYELKKFIKRAAVAKKKDHLMLGEQKNLFGAQKEVSGTYFWYPKGNEIRTTLLNLWRDEHKKQQFKFIKSPAFIPADFLKERQYRKSAKNISAYFPPMEIGDIECNFKTSLTPFHALIFQSQKPTKQQLPLRYAECAEFFEQEDEDELTGLFKARVYEADREHLFCTPEQFFEEFISSLHFIDKIIKIFGFEYHWTFVHRIQGRVPYFEKWNELVLEMEKGLKQCNVEYVKDDLTTQAFGPCVHARISDALGREWNGPFIGVDLFHAERLKLFYAEGNKKHITTLLMRSMYGSVERFIALLVEHTTGELPSWLYSDEAR